MKNLALFILLSVVFSALTACRTTTTGLANQNISVENSGTPSIAQTTNDFPAVPASIMQAQLQTPDGNAFKLEDKKGKVVLINLWGIWCGPCKAEMPDLVKLQDQYRAKNFEIIGLNVGDENGEKESAENIKNFGEKMKLNYQLGWADDKIYKELLDLSNFGGVPQSFLIDRQGKLHGVFLGSSAKTVADLKENVDKLAATN